MQVTDMFPEGVANPPVGQYQNPAAVQILRHCYEAKITAVSSFTAGLAGSVMDRQALQSPRPTTLVTYVVTIQLTGPTKNANLTGLQLRGREGFGQGPLLPKDRNKARIGIVTSSNLVIARNVPAASLQAVRPLGRSISVLSPSSRPILMQDGVTYGQALTVV